ncbi:MAG: hypothetical protein M1830_008536 [Pleopsidium flavum]|nr:MAG: hypothetical protein M1830_008536 [Pleopsidium flavum]
MLVHTTGLMFSVRYRRANDEDLQRNGDQKAAIDAVTASIFVVRSACATGVPSSRKVDLNVPLRFRTQKVLEPLEVPAPSAADSNQTWLLTTRDMGSSGKGAALAHMVLVDSAAGAKDFRFSNNAEFSADTKGETKVAGRWKHDVGKKLRKRAGANNTGGAGNVTAGAGVSVKTGGGAEAEHKMRDPWSP